MLPAKNLLLITMTEPRQESLSSRQTDKQRKVRFSIPTNHFSNIDCALIFYLYAPPLLHTATIEDRDKANDYANPFERVVKLVDLSVEPEGKDKSRFKSVLIQLKAKSLSDTRGN
jgi:hypothetical protein